MTDALDWQRVHQFSFPPGLDASADKHREIFLWWFRGGANISLPQFADRVAAAKAGRLDAWRAAPQSRLALILVLDQFPRSLYAGSAEAYALDPAALAVAEEGLRNGHYDALAHPWEKTFFILPLAHAEGPDHADRLGRVVALADKMALEAPAPLQPIYQHSARQARGNRDVISRYGRFPHRNAILQRATAPDEQAYIDKGDFVHLRPSPER
jgi:uncharacterized protein (DUF924 family)